MQDIYPKKRSAPLSQVSKNFNQWELQNHGKASLIKSVCNKRVLVLLSS